MSEEERQAWIARHLAQAPERDEVWHEEVSAVYLAAQREMEERSAA